MHNNYYALVFYLTDITVGICMQMEQGTSIGSSATGNPLPKSGTNEAATTSRSTHHVGIHTARSHPLYPILQHIAQNLRQCQKQVEAVDLRTRKME